MFSKQIVLPAWRYFPSYLRLSQYISGISSSPNNICTSILPVNIIGEKRYVSQAMELAGKTDSIYNTEQTDRKISIEGATFKNLTSITSKTKSVSEVLLILEKYNELIEKDKFDVDLFLSSDEMKHLEIFLKSTLNTIPPFYLADCLQLLMDMSKTDVRLITLLERHFKKQLRTMSIITLLKVIDIHKFHKETELRKEVCKEAVKTLHKRWIEICDCKQLLSVMYYSHKVDDKELFLKLEDKALDLAEVMQPKQLCQVLYLLSIRHRRTVPLIRAMAHYLKEAYVPLELQYLQNLMFACGRLSIYDTRLLTRTCASILEHDLDKESAKFCSSLLRSLAQLRLRNKELLRKLIINLEKNHDELTKKDKASVIISLAHLNYYSENIIRKWPTDLSSLQIQNPQLWLKIVWGLTIHNSLTSDTATSVLNPSFAQSVQVGSDYMKAVNTSLLVNIQMAADLDLNDYSGPKFAITEETSTIVKSLQKMKGNPKMFVVDSLSTMAPMDKYIKTDSVVSGYFMDMVLLVNSQGEPLPFNTETSNEDVHRLCFKVLDFFDLTVGSVVSKGQCILSLRHLTKLGYKVIQIPYHDLKDKTTTVKLVSYLQNRIKAAIR